MRINEKLYLLDYPNTKVTIGYEFFKLVEAQTFKEVIKNTITELVIANNICKSKTEAIVWCKKHNPKMVEEQIDIYCEWIYDYKTGYVGMQKKLNMGDKT